MTRKVVIGSGDFVSNAPTKGASSVPVSKVQKTKLMTTWDPKSGNIRKITFPNKFEIGIGNDTRFASNLTVHGDVFSSGSVFLKQGSSIYFESGSTTDSNYGFKDNSGIVQFKDKGGTYRNIDALRNRMAYYTTQTGAQVLTTDTIGNSNVQINTSSIADTGVIAAQSGGEFTLGTAGTYEVSFGINAATAGGTTTKTADFRFFLALSDSAGYSEIYRTARLTLSGAGAQQAQFIGPRIPFSTTGDAAKIKIIARKSNNAGNGVILTTTEGSGNQAMVSFNVKKLD